MQEPVADTSRQGHPSGCAMLVCRDQTIPWGIRRYAKPPPAKAMGHPFRQTTTWAAHRSPAAVQDYLRGLLWNDLVASLPEKHDGQSMLLELERRRVA
jgi:hypothetical protein